MLWLIVGYLLGSFPSAYVFSRLLGGRDVRRVGSGNVGGMNALRNVNVAAGLLTIVFDVGKGALAVWLAGRYGAGAAGALQGGGPVLGGGANWSPLAAAVGVVVGHNWMLFLGFEGGKGLGATVGALFVLKPVLVLVFVGLIGLGALVTRDTNVGAGLAALTLPLVFWWAGRGDGAWLAAGAALGLAVAAKHWPDFKAYRAGRRQLV